MDDRFFSYFKLSSPSRTAILVVETISKVIDTDLRWGLDSSRLPRDFYHHVFDSSQSPYVRSQQLFDHIALSQDIYLQNAFISFITRSAPCNHILSTKGVQFGELDLDGPSSSSRTEGCRLLIIFITPCPVLQLLSQSYEASPLPTLIFRPRLIHHMAFLHIKKMAVIGALVHIILVRVIYFSPFYTDIIFMNQLRACHHALKFGFSLPKSLLSFCSPLFYCTFAPVQARHMCRLGLTRVGVEVSIVGIFLVNAGD